MRCEIVEICMREESNGGREIWRQHTCHTFHLTSFLLKEKERARVGDMEAAVRDSLVLSCTSTCIRDG